VGGGAGLVTAVEVAVGELVEDGTLLYRVDGRGVWAHTSGSPLWRSLSEGSRGTDVRVVQEFIAQALGVDVRVDGVFDGQFRALVRQWQEMVGLTVDGVFDHTRIAWLPAELVVAEVKLHAAEPVPGTGAVVVMGQSSLGGVDLEGFAAVSGRADYHFIRQGQSFDLSWDGRRWTVADPAAVFELFAAESQESARVDGRVGVVGRVEFADPVEVAAVPASALVSSASRPDAGCLWLGDGSQAWEPPTSVGVLGQTLSGAVLVDAVEAVGRQVLLEPQVHVGDPDCP
jgi:peptidoglycan hydrolase-like protein with peptidoglycan-binding domain